MLMDNLPKIDLHGEERALVYALVNEFIKDQYKMGNEIIKIIHGKSTNILTKEVHDTLNANKYVKTYHLNNWNLGETIVYLKSK